MNSIPAHVPGPQSPSLYRVERGALPLLLVVVALGSFALFGSGGGDDSHITWWVVDALRRTGRILNLNGAPIEQSSSLALVLIMAALRVLIPLPTPALGVILSLIATSVTCWMTARVARRFSPSLALPVALLVGTSGPLLYWGTSGMETSLAAFAAVWLLDAIGSCLDVLPEPSEPAGKQARIVLNLFAATGLFVTVRPENQLLVLGVFATGIVCSFRALRLVPYGAARVRLVGLCVLASLIPVLGLFAWRRAIFHDWFPHPVAAKAGGAMRWDGGWKYLVHQTMDFQPAMFVLLPLSIGVVLFATVSLRAKPLGAFAAALAALGGLFICASGGDWMSCGRFLGNQLPVWWLIVAVASSFALATRPALVTWLAVAISLTNVWFLVRLTRSGGTNGYPINAAMKVVPAAREQYGLQQYSFLELTNKSHLRDALLSEELKRVVAQVAPELPEKIWIASGQAGGVPYHVFSAFPDKLRFIDFWGLTSSEAMPCIPPAQLRHSSLGVAMSPELMFKYREPILRDCGIPMADIVFNTSLRAGTKIGLEARGYRVVYWQRGAMPSFKETSTLRGGTSIEAYIAVREELAAKLRMHYREVRWTIAG